MLKIYLAVAPPFIGGKIHHIVSPDQAQPKRDPV
jgi:hypothetical protein